MTVSILNLVESILCSSSMTLSWKFGGNSFAWMFDDNPRLCFPDDTVEFLLLPLLLLLRLLPEVVDRLVFPD